MQEPVVQFSHISMEFPGVLANDDVSLTIQRGKFLHWWEKTARGKAP